MTASLRQSSTSGGVGTAASANITKPSNTVDGDILIARLFVETDSTVTAPSGWTLKTTEEVDTANHAFRVYTYWKRASSEPNSWEWSWVSSVRFEWHMLAIMDAVESGDPFHATNTAERDSTSNDLIPAVSLTTSVADIFILWSGAHGGSGNNFGSHGVPGGSGLTEIVDHSARMSTCRGTQATAGTFSAGTSVFAAPANSTATSWLGGILPSVDENSSSSSASSSSTSSFSSSSSPSSSSSQSGESASSISSPSSASSSSSSSSSSQIDEAFLLQSYDGLSGPPENGGNGDGTFGYPLQYTGVGQGTVALETTNVIVGAKSLKHTTTSGRFYPDWRPYNYDDAHPTAPGNRSFAREYGVDPVGNWVDNTYNRLNIWLFWPSNASAEGTGGQTGSNESQVELGTYVKHRTSPDINSDEAGGNHYYHFLNPLRGAWNRILVDWYPGHRRGADGNLNWAVQYPTTSPNGSGDPAATYNYFDTLTRFYMETLDTPDSYPAVAYTDQIYFYYEPNNEPADQVLCLSGAYRSSDNRFWIAWGSRKNENREFTVKYAFSDIHALGFANATNAPGDNTINNPGSAYMMCHYDTTAIDVTGQNTIYFAIKPDNQSTFRQISLPLSLSEDESQSSLSSPSSESTQSSHSSSSQSSSSTSSSLSSSSTSSVSSSSTSTASSSSSSSTSSSQSQESVSSQSSSSTSSSLSSSSTSSASSSSSSSTSTLSSSSSTSSKSTSSASSPSSESSGSSFSSSSASSSSSTTSLSSSSSSSTSSISSSSTSTISSSSTSSLSTSSLSTSSISSSSSLSSSSASSSSSAGPGRRRRKFPRRGTIWGT